MRIAAEDIRASRVFDNGDASPAASAPEPEPGKAAQEGGTPLPGPIRETA
jgi:hypothetical protein